MAQDTRKDPRAKVLSMTVRYKSATVDEFIEHHSHDVSRGGIFIKTPSPFPPGTLLKFEIRIQDEQSVLAGVGRVVWKRDGNETSNDSPAGMGVKFIKIDDKSKGLIQRLVESQPEGTPSAFRSRQERRRRGRERRALLGRGDEAGRNTHSGGRGEDPAEAGLDDARAWIDRRSGEGRRQERVHVGAARGRDEGGGGFFPKTNPDRRCRPPKSGR